MSKLPVLLLESRKQDYGLTLLVSTPPYLALTLGSWMVNRLVPVTVIMVLPLRIHTRGVQVNHTDGSQRRAERLEHLLQDGPVGLDAGDGGVLGVDVLRLQACHFGLVNHQPDRGRA